MRLIRLSLLGVAAGLTLGGAPPVVAQTFTFVGSAQNTCWESTEGINPTTLAVTQLPPDVAPSVSRFARLVHQTELVRLALTPNDRSTVESARRTTVQTGGDTPFTGALAQCPGLFSIEINGNLRVDAQCNIQASPPVLGPGFTAIENRVTTYGIIVGAGGEVLLVHAVPQPPVVERVILTIPPPNPVTPPTVVAYDRACTRAGDLLLLQGQKGQNGGNGDNGDNGDDDGDDDNGEDG